MTAVRVRRDAGMALWALVAVALLTTPFAWHNYLVLLGPGMFLLLGRGRGVPALFLIALQLVLSSWFELWRGTDTVVATLMLTLYSYVLIAHWLVFVLAAGPADPASADVSEARGRSPGRGGVPLAEGWGIIFGRRCP